MDILSMIRQGLPLEEPQGLDTLLELAELARALLAEGRSQELRQLIRYLVAKSYYDARDNDYIQYKLVVSDE